MLLADSRRGRGPGHPATAAMYHTEEVADVLIPIIHASEKPILMALLVQN